MLLYGHKKNAYWYGSRLTIEETRALAPYQNATGLQVTSAVLAGMVWALENPKAGIVEADDMDYRRCLEVQKPYLGEMAGVYTDWTPLHGRPGLFPRILTDRSMAVQEHPRPVKQQSNEAQSLAFGSIIKGLVVLGLKGGPMASPARWRSLRCA